MKKNFIYLLPFLVLPFLLSGCSRTETPDEESVETAVTSYNDMDQLEDGGFYILSDGEYSPLYYRDASYEVDDYNETDTSHTLWFSDDWSEIPTAYAGDLLIYKTTSDLDESFTIERFEYVGPTLGIANLKQMESGRYSYSTKEDDLNINPSSSAQVLMDLDTSFCIIDRIGNADLRSGNVSSGGCILGLELGKTYLAEVYAGSIYHEYKLTADCIALTSMEAYQTVDYDFMQSQILRINFPSWWHSGFYMINGIGLVRYISGSYFASEDETDMNIPNIKPSSDHMVDEEGYYLAAVGSDSFPFSIMEPSKVTITVTYDDPALRRYDEDEEDVKEIDPPVCLIKGAASSYSLSVSEDDSHILTKTITLMAGNYSLDISELQGRRFKVDIIIGN